MNDLDSVWENLLTEAAGQVASEGLLADFLAVKSANDQLREHGVGQLLAAFEKIAGHANRNDARITIETIDRHRFEFENFHVSGRAVKFRQGVRCLSVEAGWTRSPRDGFMRGNALAVARISHFGLPLAGHDLRLLRFEDSVGWFRLNPDDLRVSFELDDMLEHFRKFLG